MNCKGYVVSRQDTNKNNTKCKLSVWCLYNTTPVTPCSTEHFLKCFLTAHLRLYSRSHKLGLQENCSYSECTGWCCINSTLYRNALDIHCKHTASQLHVAERVSWSHDSCCISSDKMSQMNQVPSLCDFSRCRFSSSSRDNVYNGLNSVYMSTASDLPKQFCLGQAVYQTTARADVRLIENAWISREMRETWQVCGFASVWIRAWSFRLLWILNSIPQSDIHVVYCCCVQVIYVSASCFSCWNSCHTVNTCTVSLPCGLGGGVE